MISGDESPSHAEVCAENRYGANGIVPTISAIGNRQRPMFEQVKEWAADQITRLL
jgi:hypothetical protein